MEHDWPMSTIWQLTGDIELAISCTQDHEWESTDENFGTHEKVAIPISIVTCTVHIPISIFIISVFPFPWDSRKNKAQTFALVIPLFVNDRRPNSNLFETEIVLHINFRYLP